MNKELLEVIQRGDIKRLNALIEQGIDIHQKDEKGNNALLFAAVSGKTQMIDHLLKIGFKISEKNNAGNTAFLFAVVSGRFDTIEYFLKQGSKISEKNNEGETAVFLAVKNDNFTLVEFFLKRGSSLSETNKEGDTALQWAAAHGKIEMVKYLLKHGSGVSEKNNKGETLLLTAASHGHDEIVNYLLNEGANISEKNNNDETALLLAADKNDIKMVAFLLKRGSELTEQNKLGKTALLYAAARGNNEMVEFLLDMGSRISATNKEGDTALMVAAYHGHITTIDCLLKRRSVISNRNKIGDTAYLMAVKSGHIPTAEHLLKMGSEKNERNSEGYTAFLIAAFYGHIKMMAYLLRNGSRLSEKNNKGETALLIAASKGYIEMVEYLLRTGSELSEKDNDGDTAFLLAAFNGKTEILKNLLDRPEVSLRERSLDNGHNVLSYSAGHGHVESVAFLLKKGAYIDMLLSDGNTASQFVEEDIINLYDENDSDNKNESEKNLLNMKNARSLLRAAENLLLLAEGKKISESEENLLKILGESLNARQITSGDTALHHAIRQKNIPLVISLFEHGADIMIANHSNITPLQMMRDIGKEIPCFHALSCFFELKYAETNFQENSDSGLEKDYKTFFDENEVEASLRKMSSKELIIVCFKLGKLFSNHTSVFFNPLLGYRYLIRATTESDFIHLKEAHNLIAGLLISKKITFQTNGLEVEAIEVDNTLIGKVLELNESEEEKAHRLKAIIKHIHYGDSYHQYVLGNYIAEYVYGSEKSMLGLEGVRGKDTESFLALVEHLRESQLALQRKDIEIKRLKDQLAANMAENNRLLKENTLLKSKQRKLQSDMKRLRTGEENGEVENAPFAKRLKTSTNGAFVPGYEYHPHTHENQIKSKSSGAGSGLGLDSGSSAGFGSGSGSSKDYDGDILMKHRVPEVYPQVSRPGGTRLWLLKSSRRGVAAADPIGMYSPPRLKG